MEETNEVTRPSTGRLMYWWGALFAGGGIGAGAIVLAFAGPMQLPLIALGVGVLLVTAGWLADHA